MNTYLISYNLIKPETSLDYARLVAKIQAYTYWAKPLRNVWIIQTPLPVAQIRDNLRLSMGANDTILVIEVTRNWASLGLPKEVTDWMKNNF